MAKVINPSTGETRFMHNGERVYIIRRDGTYKHTLHRVANINDKYNGRTYCNIVIRDLAVLSDPTDAITWCENGCKPATPDTAALAEIDARIAQLAVLRCDECGDTFGTDNRVADLAFHKQRHQEGN